MFCRKCGTELEKDQTVCPSCGENNASDRNLKIIVTVVCVLLLALVLSLVVMKTMKVGLFAESEKDQTPTETTGQSQESETTAAAVDYPSYAVDDATAAASMEEVIAASGDYELTNGLFQIFYWFQVYNYYEQYQTYIQYGYLSLDVTAPLSEQACGEDATISWEQFFTQKAMKLWHSYAAMNMLADKEGYEMPADLMPNLRADLLEDAQAAGYETADAYIQNMLDTEVGPGTTVEHYWAYMEFVNRATSYYADWYEKVTPTTAEMEAYYNENEQTFVDGGSGKDDGNTVDVRHILIMADEDTDAGWKAAEEEAQRILQEWKDGGATEELFAELANKYSEDDGSNTAGGLYTGVKQGETVEAFNDWIMDTSRKSGDTAIVKADYYYQGYHIMYFVDGQPVWESAVLQTMMAEKATTMLSGSMDAYPLEKFEENLKIGQPHLS